MTWKVAASVIFIFCLLTVFVGSANAQCDQCPGGDPPNDRAFKVIQRYEAEPLAYDHIRESDVFWSKKLWRVIYFGEKMNHPFAYPKEPFVGILLEAALNGELRAYSPLTDDFSMQLSREDLEAKLWRVDTVPLFDMVYGDYIGDTVYYSEPDYTRFHKLMLLEEWVFDIETSTMVCRILGMAPMRPFIDEYSGLTLGEETVCWIPYQEARPIMVAHEAFNPFNDGVRRSWDDIMEMRFFSSLIVKESNVHDRFIQDYASGEDAVIESEEIKQELFRFEHELWEY